MKPLIAIITCHKFKGRADAQRKTWIPLMEGLSENKRIDIKFFLGRGANREPLPDEVFLDVPDDYDSLPYKVRAAMRWAVKHEYDIVLKCDDDVYIFPERLAGSFPNTPYEGRLNNSQHKVAPYGWCSGFAYWLGGNALTIIAQHKGEPESKYEDLWVGMTLSKHQIKCKIQHNFLVLSYIPKPQWKDYKNHVIAALCSEGDLAEMHNIFRNNAQPTPDPQPINSVLNRTHTVNKVFPIRRRGRWLA